MRKGMIWLLLCGFTMGLVGCGEKETIVEKTPDDKDPNKMITDKTAKKKKR